MCPSLTQKYVIPGVLSPKAYSLHSCKYSLHRSSMSPFRCLPPRVAYLVPGVLPTSAVCLFPDAPLLRSFPLFWCSYPSSMPLSRCPLFYSSSVSISWCPLFSACLFPGAPPSSVASSRCLPSSSMPLFRCPPLFLQHRWKELR